MAPPSYPDIGKLARDIFSKGYHFGLWKLDCTTNSSAGIELSTSGAIKQDSGKVAGALQTKYRLSDYGLTMSEKWTTDNLFLTDIFCTNKIAEGLKLGAAVSYAPQSGDKEGKIIVGYGQEKVQFDGDISIDLAGPLINAAVVVGHEGWLGGYQTALDTQEVALTKNNLAIGYTINDTVLHAALNNFQEITGSVFQRCSDKLQCALQASYDTEAGEGSFGIGCQYFLLEGDASVRAKINSDAQIGVGYQQKVYAGTTISLSALIEGKDVGGGEHKIGAALNLEA